jgi:nitroreductase
VTAHDISAGEVLQLTADELLTTTRTVRKRLDFDRPVERSLVEECLRIAFQAPNGSNQQDYGWVVVDDPGVRRSMAELYRAGMADHGKRDMTSEAIVPQSNPRISASVRYLAERFERVPMLLVPTFGRRYGDSTTFQQASLWGSILPAVWSFMLALRARGLGSAWTTIHLYREKEMAELLGIPYPEQRQAGLFPIAYTLGTEFKPADRAKSEQRIFWNGWSKG